MSSDFRERVALDVLVERVVPPFRPPEVRTAGAMLTAFAVFGLVGGAAGIHGSLAGQGWAMLAVVVPVAAICITGAYLYLRQQTRKRAAYIALHHKASDRAWRMLSGKGGAKWGDSEAALRAESEELLRLQEPPPRGASMWVFVWYDAGG